MPEQRVVGTGPVRGRPVGAVRGVGAATPPPAPEPPQKKRFRLRPFLIGLAVVAVVAAGLGAAVFTGKLPWGQESPTSGAVSAEAKRGETIDIDPVSLNLADGHYLRVGFTMVMSADAKGEISTAPAKDAVIGLFSGRSVDEVNGDSTRNDLKTTLLAQLNDQYDGKVVDLYYTDYVTQ